MKEEHSNVGAAARTSGKKRDNPSGVMMNSIVTTYQILLSCVMFCSAGGKDTRMRIRKNK